MQVAMPRGAEDDARRFNAAGLGLTEVAKPADLAGRGGAWFRALDGEGVVTAEVHVGVEETFVPARKAHPALVVTDVPVLDTLADRLVSLGFEVDARERDTFPGYVRFHTFDCHGNRVEVLAPQP